MDQGSSSSEEEVRKIQEVKMIVPDSPCEEEAKTASPVFSTEQGSSCEEEEEEKMTSLVL